MRFTSIILLGAAFFQSAVAHPADESPDAIAFTKRYQEKAIRDLERCQGNLLKNRELHERRFEKREAWLNDHAARRGIERRNLHKRSLGIEERQVQCVLAPEVTIGPYWLDSMPLRKDVREDEAGVELLLELQFINVANCQPVPNAYVDIWHANSTGKYAGFRSEGTQGETFLRGVQPTDANGVAKFTTTWPGHYQGRAVHTHIMVRTGGRVNNGVYTGGSRPHIGQLFYDQNLITTVTALQPYASNKTPLVLNLLDFIFWQQSSGYNSIVKTEFLGQSAGQGIVASIVVGIRV